MLSEKQFDKRFEMGRKAFDAGLGKKKQIHDLTKMGPNTEAYPGLDDYMSLNGANKYVQNVPLITIRNKSNKPVGEYYRQRSIFAMIAVAYYTVVHYKCCN